MSVSAIVTHPSTLFRDSLGQILAVTRFRPVHLAAGLDDVAIRHLLSAETCLWLNCLEQCNDTTYDLVRRTCVTAPGVKAIILAQIHNAENVWRAIEAGAKGFLCQDISCDRLIKSLELIALGETIVPSDFVHAMDSRITGQARAAASAESSKAKSLKQAPSVSLVSDDMANEKDDSIDSKPALVDRLSKRETSILHLLMKGASNKMIARELVITEATAKVHIKAILRKLTLLNRTQAAMWACKHLASANENYGGSQNTLVSVHATFIK